MKRIPLTREPLHWAHPGLGQISLYPEGTGWACDINGDRAWTFMTPNRVEVESAVRTDLNRWSFIEKFRKETL